VSVAARRSAPAAGRARQPLVHYRLPASGGLAAPLPGGGRLRRRGALAALHTGRGRDHAWCRASCCRAP